MSATRVSFGSRAGGGSDYPGVGQEVFLRPTSHHSSDSLADLVDALRNEIAGAANSEVPECTTSEMSLSGLASVPLVRPGVGPYSEGGAQDLPAEFKTNYAVTSADEHEPPSSNNIAHPQADASSIINVASSRDRAIVQRAASRGIVQALEAMDGFRYSFNNAWAAKDEEGSRFSYICQDSMQNKDRHANGYQRTTKHLKGGEFSRGPRKPTYDCKGSVSVKFSMTRQRVDVYYRHYAIHATVKERKPPERPPPGSRRLYNSRAPAGNTELEEQASAEHSTFGDAPPPSASNIGRPLKRKRSEPSGQKTTSSATKPLSLADILRQSSSANANTSAPAPVDPAPIPQSNPNNPPPVAYELPSWQIPPPVPINRQMLNGALPYKSPYPPPYMPTNARPPPSRPAQPVPTHRPGQPVASHPRGQGLFATLKPVERNGATMSLPGQMYVTPVYGTGVIGQGGAYKFVTPGGNGVRAKVSCVNCRNGKKKCDEGQPCTGCVRSGRTDCVYECGPNSAGVIPTSTAPPQSAASWSMPETASTMAAAVGTGRMPSIDFGSPNDAAGNFSKPKPNMEWRNPLGAPSVTVLAQSDSMTPRERAAMARQQEMAQSQMQLQREMEATENGMDGREESPDPWFPRR